MSYSADLAHVHHTGFGEFARSSAPWLLEQLTRAGIGSGHVVDLGSGSGIWARALIDAGYSVTGIDFSPGFVELARQHVPEADFRTESCLTARLPPARAVTALGEVLNYAFDPRNSLAALARLFKRVHRALAPGGLFIFDVAEPGRCRDVTQRFVEHDDWTCLVTYEHDDARRRLTRQIVTFRRSGRLYRRHEETHVQQLYSRRELLPLLRAAGFRVRVLAGYGVNRFPPHLTGFLCRK